MNTLPVLIADSQNTVLHHLSVDDVLQLEWALAFIIKHRGFGGLDVIMEKGNFRLSEVSGHAIFHRTPQTKNAKKQATPTRKGLYQGDRSEMLHHLPNEYIKWLDKRIGYLKEVNGGFGVLKAKVEYGTIREVSTCFTEYLPKENTSLQNTDIKGRET